MTTDLVEKRELSKFLPLFSPRDDFFIFVFPVLACSLCIAFLYGLKFSFPVQLNDEVLRTSFYVIYSLLFLTPHVYSTFYKYKVDQHLTSFAYQFETKVFILLISISSLLFFNFGWIFISIVTYADIFHNVRQQYGWLVLTQRKQDSITRGEAFLDKLMLYNVTLAPLIWWHANPTQYGWMQTKDIIFFLPDWAGSLALGVHWIITSIFFAIYLYWYLKGRRFNLGKILVILSTWFAYFGGIVFLPDTMKILFITFNHTIPYLFLVFRYCKNPGPPLDSSWITFTQKFSTFYLPLVIFSLGLASLQFLRSSNPSRLNTLIAFIPVCASIFHYYFDSVVWRVKKRETRLVPFFSFNQK